MTKLLPGDIVLGKPESKMGWGVVLFEGLFGDPADFSHVGMVTREGVIGASNPLEQPWVTEALMKVECEPFSKNWSGRKYTIYRPVYASSVDRVCMAEKAEEYVGRPYGWWKLLLIAIDARISQKRKKDTRIFSRLLHRESEPICSFLVQDVFYDCVNEDFGVPEYTAMPDDIGDACEASPDRYERVVRVG
jgi:hypothetical protein